ncbi:MAG: hypothetical protein JWR19_1013 [Pedosphaera sp.]|nr:hypothetical protein [Pedosphaera sp.]
MMNDKKVRNAKREINRGVAEARRIHKGDLALEKWEQAENAEGAAKFGVRSRGGAFKNFGQ